MATINVTNTADSGAGSLRNAIAAAANGDVIKFAPKLAGETITLRSQLEVPAGKSLTIDGSDARGLILSGNDQNRILLLQSTSATPSRLTVKNLTLADGYTPDRGGAISTEHQGSVVIENVLFKGNRADKGGGAIFTAFEGTLSVRKSQFVGNVATAGNDERGAGAIAFWGPRECTIIGSQFRNNRGINGGAINSLNGKLTVKNSKFFNNDVTAATYVDGGTGFLRGYGGAIFTDRASSTSEPSGTIKLLNNVFEGNKGRAAGGAAYLYTGTQDNVIIDRATFKDNSVSGLPRGEGGNAGALMVISNGLNRGVKLSNASFIDNTAAGQGGGLWTMDAPTTITNSTFSGNRVTGNTASNVGGAMSLYSPTDIINSTIARNYAGWTGGGVAASGEDAVSVKNTIFFNNSAGNQWNIQDHSTAHPFIDCRATLLQRMDKPTVDVLKRR
jgi:predicted outer membrane repeat protein